VLERNIVAAEAREVARANFLETKGSTWFLEFSVAVGLGKLMPEPGTPRER
jgi:hypothetical protein